MPSASGSYRRLPVSRPGVLKVHPFFWLSEPYDNAYLRRWFRAFRAATWILRHSAPFNRITSLIRRFRGAMIRFPCVPGGDMARYRKSCCRPCRM